MTGSAHRWIVKLLTGLAQAGLLPDWAAWSGSAQAVQGGEDEVDAAEQGELDRGGVAPAPGLVGSHLAADRAVPPEQEARAARVRGGGAGEGGGEPAGGASADVVVERAVRARTGGRQG